ncbi:hypothetical protein ACFX13_048011 [Malus domestica]
MSANSSIAILWNPGASQLYLVFNQIYGLLVFALLFLHVLVYIYVIDCIQISPVDLVFYGVSMLICGLAWFWVCDR